MKETEESFNIGDFYFISLGGGIEIVVDDRSDYVLSQEELEQLIEFLQRISNR